ncbi:ABC transporter ATP-binding protein [Candidatus Halobonum tyrrellensis]|uniref:ABC-type transport system ATP-binding protein n=1 Tax=Candidatus Halobonum tyrrellensis G22 TaxID=1324957 RepID=V4H944_9EURY|nr:ABC transporter ATP-binding protein [Candidatus Halobonum tyrrellensis]ESP87235.1 ABC-type transport system ATP-binding protein [Candidatus Halobonum tyrrellensis G22]
MTPPLAIDADGLSKRYGDTVAVDSVDLAVEAGSVYGFLGPNGAGKTTTMRMLTTLTTPTDGTARVAGAPVSDRSAVVDDIGYLPDEPPLFDELTGREQLEYVAALRDLPEPAAVERIDALLGRFGLADDADRRIDGYSKGMKQKVGIVQAILHDPAVLFLDEPTSGLDPRAARTVRDTVADLAAGETTVFLSTHILPVVDELADTVGVLSEGRLVTEGAPEALKRRAESGEERTLEDVFLDVTDGVGTDRAAGATTDDAESTDPTDGRPAE